MHQGNWKCSKCGGAITELPFEPRGEAGLTCRTCYAKGKAEGETPMDSAGAVPEMDAAPEQDGSDAPAFDPMAAPADMSDAPAPPDEGTVVEPGAEKPKFEGDWKCSGCGAAITNLPFQPRGDANLKCMDCFKKSKA